MKNPTFYMKNYKIATRGIAYEHFDDETVAINLPIGHYYSMRGTAHFIFQLLGGGSNVSQIAGALTASYDISLVEANAAAETFIEDLNKAELLMETDTITELINEENSTRMPFETPVLETHDDMTEMLTLDPVHDVNPTEGWPLKK